MSLNRRYRFTSESVTEGHPDKLADQISDAVLDAVLEQDPGGKVACETLLAAGLALVAGEIRTKADLDIPAIVRRTILAAGYTDDRYGLNGRTCAVLNGINQQSRELTKNADAGKAGDQGLMFGFACGETPELMPLPITLAHRLARRLAEVRKSGALPWLRPDGKTQVTVEYEDGRPRRVATVLISAQHRPRLAQDKIKAALFAEVVQPVLGAEWPLDQPDFLCNPSTSFTVGGPQADCGLTGRKIIVDTYGGYARHGGGAFSGKDPSKVDRSAAYLARYIAKNLVAAGLAERVEVQLAYAIGRADPVSVLVDTQGTGQVDEEKLEQAVQEVFPLTPAGIITGLRLRRPIYRATAAYGHFGREEEDFTWERTDRVAELQRRLR